MKSLAFVLSFFFFAGAIRASEPDDRFAPFEKAKVHYRMSGAGEDALIFVHGWACDANFWRLQAGEFPDSRVIAIDLPGHGRSGKPQAAYTLDYFARSIEAVMRHAKISRAVLVGHSMGAPVVGRFYGLYPKKTLGLVIVDGAMRPFLPIEQIEGAIAELLADYRAAAPPMIDSMLAPVKDAKLRREIRAAMLSTPAHVAIGAMRGMADEKAYERGPITVPVLAVLAKSHGWSADTEPFLRALAPTLELVFWDEVSPFLMMDKPAEFNRSIREFLLKNHLVATKGN